MYNIQNNTTVNPKLSALPFAQLFHQSPYYLTIFSPPISYSYTLPKQGNIPPPFLQNTKNTPLSLLFYPPTCPGTTISKIEQRLKKKMDHFIIESLETFIG